MMLSRPGLEELKSYAVAEETGFAVKLDANERSADLPAAVRECVLSRLASLEFHRYPDMAAMALRTKIADAYGLQPENILIGNGSSQLLEVMCYAFGGAGRSILFPAPSFSMYGTYVKLADSRAVPVMLAEDFSLSPDKMLAAAAEHQASLVILCNPNNPTGNSIPAKDIEAIIAGADCPVVVDEAYMEFYGQSAAPLLAKYQNLIIARTFSKAYGLASARVGYLLAAPALTAIISKVLMPYHANSLSLAAAEVVFDMRQEFQPDIEQTISERKRLAARLQEFAAITVYPSATNFLLLRTPQAKELAEYLASQSISIRDFSSAPGLTNCLRITIGTADENDKVLQAVAAFFEVNP